MLTTVINACALGPIVSFWVKTCTYSKAYLLLQVGFNQEWATSGIVAYYIIEEGRGSVIRDYTGTMGPGRLFNNPVWVDDAPPQAGWKPGTFPEWKYV